MLVVATRIPFILQLKGTYKGQISIQELPFFDMHVIKKRRQIHVFLRNDDVEGSTQSGSYTMRNADIERTCPVWKKWFSACRFYASYNPIVPFKP